MAILRSSSVTQSASSTAANTPRRHTACCFPTLAQVRLDGNLEVLFSDTVGFIQKLPTQLVAAFRATLEEIAAASVVVHVLDVSAPNAAAQCSAVLQVRTKCYVLGMQVRDLAVLFVTHLVLVCLAHKHQAMWRRGDTTTWATQAPLQSCCCRYAECRAVRPMTSSRLTQHDMLLCRCCFVGLG